MNSSLLLSHGSLRRTPFDTRLAAAAAAGFVAASMFVSEVRDLRRGGWSDEALRARAGFHHVHVRDIEVLSGWVEQDGEPGRLYRAAEEQSFALASIFGSQAIQAIAPVGGDPARAASRFAALCDRAGAVGLEVVLEFMPHTDLPTLASARNLVERAGRGNGGLCIDAFHLFHAGETPDDVAALPDGMIRGVQLCDGRAVHYPDYGRAMLSERLPCGDGDFPLRELLGAVAAATCPLAIEVFNPRLWARDPFDMAQEHASKAHALLASAGQGLGGDRQP